MVDKNKIRFLTTNENVHNKAEEILNRLTEEEKQSPEVVLALLDLHFYLRGNTGLDIPPETYQRYGDKFMRYFER